MDIRTKTYGDVIFLQLFTTFYNFLQLFRFEGVKFRHPHLRHNSSFRALMTGRARVTADTLVGGGMVKLKIYEIKKA